MILGHPILRHVPDSSTLEYTSTQTRLLHTKQQNFNFVHDYLAYLYDLRGVKTVRVLPREYKSPAAALANKKKM